MTTCAAAVFLVATAVQSSADGVPTTVLVLIAGMFLMTAATGILAFKWKTLQRMLDELGQKNQNLQQKLEHQNSINKEHMHRLEKKREKISDLKRDVAQQRKKNHAQQEELKQTKEAHAKEKESLERALQTKPAFEKTEKEKTEAKPVVVEPKQKTKQPEKPVEASPKQETINTVDAKKLDTLRTELLSVEAKYRALQEEQTRIKDANKTLREENRSLKKRMEGLRRIDVISNNKVELLEDKLSHLGKQYYEALSEIAVLKGEVKPLSKRKSKRSKTNKKSSNRTDVPEKQVETTKSTLDADSEKMATTSNQPDVRSFEAEQQQETEVHESCAVAEQNVATVTENTTKAKTASEPDDLPENQSEVLAKEQMDQNQPSSRSLA